MNELLLRFDELCDLDPDERESRLLTISEQDAALALRLRAMLAADSKGTDWIAHDIEQQPALSENAFSPAAQATILPADFGGYRLLRELGSGGMGVVWLAERSLGSSTQLVAIKFVRQANNAALLKHFSREREALARLEHPNIARLIDAGSSPEGAPYIATEFVDGTNLLDFARANQLELPDRLKLFESLCDAVDYAHRRLLVHRDIKPSNVMVDGSGRVRLLDFGIAKALDVGNTELTENNPLSPAYAAPEQLLGEPISTATDIFALGLLLFVLLTGQLPAQRRTGSAFGLANRVTTESIEPPSTAVSADSAAIDTVITLRDWSKRLRGDLDQIVLKALRREPERRYASALALAEDLRRFREGRTISARPDSTGYRLRRLVARNPVLSTLAALSLSLIVGLSVAALIYAERAREQSEVALAEAQNARAAAVQTSAVNAFFSARLAAGRITEQGAGAGLLHKDWVMQALPKLDTELADAPKARALLRRQFGVALRDLGEKEQALNTLTLAVREATAAFGESSETATAWAYLGAVQRDAADASARASIDQAIAIFDRLPATEAVRTERVSAMTTLLRIQTAEGDYVGALATARRNIVERSALFGADSPRLAVDYNNLSAQLSRVGQLAAAEKANDKAMALIRAQPDPPMARIALLERSTCLLARGRAQYERALAACERSRQSFAAALGDEHPDTVDIDMVVSAVRLDQGQFEQARILLTRPSVLKTPSNDLGLQRIRLAAFDRNWPQVQAIGERSANSEEVVERMIRCYVALAKWMRSRTPANLTALQDLVALMQPQFAAPDMYRAQSAALLSLALIADGEVQAADTQKQRAIAVLRNNMDAEAAERLWSTWLASGPSA